MAYDLSNNQNLMIIELIFTRDQLYEIAIWMSSRIRTEPNEKKLGVISTTLEDDFDSLSSSSNILFYDTFLNLFWEIDL